MWWTYMRKNYGIMFHAIYVMQMYILCHMFYVTSLLYYDKYVSDAVKVDQSHSPRVHFERFGVEGKKFDPS